MRTTITLASILLLALFAAPVMAQQDQAIRSETTGQMDDTRMMGGGNMMQGEMQRGAKMGRGMGMMMHGGKGSGGTCRICGMQGGMKHGGMMRGGMMGHGRMGCEMHRFMKVIYHLPVLKEQLELSQDQSSSLKKLQTTFLKNKADWRAEMEKARIDLDNKLESEADARDIRSILESMAKVKVDMKVSGYETAQEMMAVLKPEQKKRWCNFCSMCQQNTWGMMEDQDN